MSLPDYLLDEPDYCADHGRPQPCSYCRQLARMERAERLYDEERDRVLLEKIENP